MVDRDNGSSGELQAALHRLSSRVVDQAVHRDTRLTWVTPQIGADAASADGWRWSGQDAAPWLYDGLAGIARGLAYSASVVRSDDPALGARMRATAEQALRRALEMSLDTADGPPFGLYDGHLGVACVACELGRLWQDDALVREGHGLAVRVLVSADTADGRGATPAMPAPVDASAVDLVSGSAGLVCGAAWITGWTRSAHTARLAEAHTRRLSDVRGIGPGLAHGLAGVAVALAHAWRLRPNDATLRQLCDAEQRENAWFSTAAGSWPDIRSDQTQYAFPPWWCHGAAGIGLARQRVAELTGLLSGDTAVARHHVRLAVQRRQRQEATRPDAWVDWSLCHGVAGALALLVSDAGRLDARQDHQLARRILVDGSVEAQATGGRWQGGASVPDEQTGLMTGHAGILLTLTRAVAGESRCSWPLWL